jgi:molybdopterin-guanine dinucleotide biosynthesis protein A
MQENRVAEGEESVLGAVLAGGRRRRLGRDKALVMLGGRPLLAHALRALQGVFSEAVIVSAPGSDYPNFGVEVVTDLYPDRGPLAGIHTALVHAGGRAVFVLACDLPHVTSDVVRFVADLPRPGRPWWSQPGATAKVAQWRGRLQPLCGVYAAACRKPAEESLRREELGATEFLGKISTTPVPITSNLPFYRSDLFQNINRPEDLRAARSRRGGELPVS